MDNLFYIRVETFFYKDIGPQNGLLRDDNWKVMAFSTVEEANAMKKKLEDANRWHYVWEEGEVGLPKYEVIPAKGWGDDCIKAEGDELEEYVLAERVPEEVKEQLLAKKPISYIPYKQCTLFVAFSDNEEYAILYCPIVEALDYYEDDLGKLNWDKPTFVRRKTLSDFFKQHESVMYRYTGSLWGNYEEKALGATLVGFLRDFPEYDGLLIDHPACGKKKSGYYIESGNVLYAGDSIIEKLWEAIELR